MLDAGATAGNSQLYGGVALTFSTGVTGIETLSLAAGLAAVDNATGADVAGSVNDYTITLVAQNVAAGSVMAVNAGSLRAAVVTGLGADTAVGGTGGNADTTDDENLVLDASAVTGTGAGSVNVTGGAAADTITASGNADTVSSGAGNDSVVAGAGSDSVDAGAGNNTVAGGAGNDTITAGSGNDSVTDTGGNDSISVGDGNNTINDSGAGNDTIVAGAGNDSITDDGGSNSITTGDGNNTVSAGAGSDTIVGGAGNDDITAGGGVDNITLGGGSNIVRYTLVSDSTGVNIDNITGFVSGTDKIMVTQTVGASTDADTLDFSGFAVVGSFASGQVSLAGTTSSVRPGDSFYSTVEGNLYVDSNGDGQINQNLDLIVKVGTLASGDVGFSVDMGDGNDTVTGGAGSDSIIGGAGNDNITAGGGADTLTGGAGNDTFNFAAGASGTPSGTNFDVITDYVSGADTIAFTGGIVKFATAVTAASGTAGVAVGTGIVSFNGADNTLALKIAAVANALGAASAGNALIFQDGTDSYIFITDGTAGVGSNDVLIKLVGVNGVGSDELTVGGGSITGLG